MKKTIWIIVVPIFAIAIGFFIGRFFLKSKSNDDTTIAENNINIIKAEDINNTAIAEIPTNATNKKISINTNIEEITYYNKCNHQIENKIKNTEKYVNMTEEEFQKKFPTWEIKEFDADKVVLYKEEDDYCQEHFLVKDEDGVVTIYTIDNEERVLELLDKTNIATEYLAQVDQENLKKGIIIYTKQNLNKLIEDFE